MNGYARSGSTVSSGSSSNSSRKGSGNMSCAKDVKDVVIVGEAKISRSTVFFWTPTFTGVCGNLIEEGMLYFI